MHVGLTFWEPPAFTNFTLAFLGSSWPWNLFWNLDYSWSLEPLLFKFLDILLSLNYSIDWAYTMSLSRVSLNRSVTPITKWLISSLVLDRRDGAYLDNIENFKEHSSMLILPWLRLIHSFILTSLLSRGNYFPRKASLKYPHSIGPDSHGLLSFHWVNHTWETSLNWYEA